MHKYPEYTFTSYEKPKEASHGKAMAGAMLGFMSIGFILGLVLLAVRNWYLFS